MAPSAAQLHSKAEIQRFLGDGETRMIAAGYWDPDRASELYVLPDGQAREQRAWAKLQLRCMFADCPSPGPTTVSRAHGRDGFRHLSAGGGHAPESVHHRQGKAVVAHWLQSLYPDAEVIVEYATDTQRSNVADVMLLHPNGRKVAFEVQYAALSVAEWRRRHDSYVAQGIMDIWLWGHTRVRRSRREYASGPYRLEDVQEEARQSGMRVSFLNAETSQIGIAIGRRDWRTSLAAERECGLYVTGLEDVVVSDHGLTSPSIARFAAVNREISERERVELEEEELRRQKWEHLAQLRALEREREADRQAAEAEQRRRSQERIAQLQARRRVREAELRAQAREEIDRRRHERALQLAAARAEREAGQLRCSICGGKLSPVLEGIGHHVPVCRPRGGSGYRR